MPIILISSDAIGAEQPIAEAAAKKLDYRPIGPEILPDIAATFDMPAEKLAAALAGIPSSWRIGQSRQWSRQLACIEAEVLERLKPDRVVCWGLGAHLYVRGVSHALKVRLLTDGRRRAAAMADEQGVPLAKASRRIETARRSREQWSEAAFGQNETESSLYDLTINMDQIDADEAVAMIAGAAAYRRFQPMTYSVGSLTDNILAAKVKATLLKSLTDVRVEARGGTVVVTSKALKRERQKKTATIKELAGSVGGVDFVEVHLINYVIRAAAESGR